MKNKSANNHLFVVRGNGLEILPAEEVLFRGERKEKIFEAPY